MCTPTKVRLTADVLKIAKRNIGILAPALQKASDPIQQIFVNKIREYRSKSQDGKLVDPTPEIEKERESELERVALQYGGGKGVNMAEFPKFNFTDPPVDPGLTPKEPKAV